MKFESHRWTSGSRRLVGSLTILALLSPASAATIDLLATQPSTNSWLTASDWSNTAAPSSGNDYVVDNSYTLRAQNISGNETFGGDSLTLESGARLALKGTAARTITVNDLRMNGGILSHFGGDFSFALGGNITLGDATTSIFDSSTTAGRLIDVTAGIGGTGSLRARGNQVSLIADNTYSGATTIDSNASLQIGNGGTTGSIANTTGVANSGTLIYNRSNALDAGYAISGSGSLTKLGTGTLTLSNTNAYSGGTSIGNNTSNVGIVNATASNALGTGKATIISNGSTGNLAKLTLNSGTGITLSNDFDTSGTGPSGDLIENQSGNNVLSGNITLVGGGGSTAIRTSGGSLTLSGDINVNYSSGRTLFLRGTADGEVSGTLSDGNNPLTLTKQDAGTWVLSGANTHSGNTSVNAGTLHVTGSIANSALTVGANGTIGANGLGGVLGNGLTLNDGAELDLTGASLAANSTGILSLTGGALTLDNLTFQDLVGWDWANADAGTYEIIDGAFTINWGSTAYLDAGSVYDFGNGKQGYFNSGSLQVVIIPEPSSFALLGLGAIGLLLRRRR